MSNQKLNIICETCYESRPYIIAEVDRDLGVYIARHYRAIVAPPEYASTAHFRKVDLD